VYRTAVGLWAGIAGKSGAKVLQGILADLDQSIGLAGIKDTVGCERAMLMRKSLN